MMLNAWLDEPQAGIKIVRRNMQPQICTYYHSKDRKWRGIKEPLNEGERRVKKLVEAQYYKKTNIMVSGPITSWQIEEGKLKAVENFIFLGSKITVDSNCSHEIKKKKKKCWLLGRKPVTNLGRVLKSRDIILLTKVHIVKAMFFSRSHVQMWESDHKEDWALKNWYFQIVLLEKILESSSDSKEINPEYSLEGLMLKLKLQ